MFLFHTKNFYSAYDISEIMGICYAKALAFIKYSGIHYIRINRTYLVFKDTFYSFVKETNDVQIDI